MSETATHESRVLVQTLDLTCFGPLPYTLASDQTHNAGPLWQHTCADAESEFVLHAC